MKFSRPVEQALCICTALAVVELYWSVGWYAIVFHIQTL